jgi:hypothetical protein
MVYKTFQVNLPFCTYFSKWQSSATWKHSQQHELKTWHHGHHAAPCCGLRSNWMLDWANGADPCCEVHVQPARTKILIFSSCSSWVSPTSSYEKSAFSLTLGSFLCRSKSWTWLESLVPRFSHHESWLFIHHPSQRGPWPQWTLPNQPTSGPNLRDTTMEWARNYGNIWMLVVLTCFNHLEWEGLYDYPIYIYEMENNTCSKPPTSNLSLQLLFFHLPLRHGNTTLLLTGIEKSHGRLARASCGGSCSSSPQ